MAQLPKVKEIIVFFVVGNNVLELIEANLENFLIVSASRLSIY